MDSEATSRDLSRELTNRMMHPLCWEGSAAPALDKAEDLGRSLQQHRDQGSCMAETLDINSWVSSVFGPLYTCLTSL